MGLRFNESLAIASRTYFSIQHIQSADLFARKAHEIEEAYDGSFSNERHANHRAYVIGCIFSATSFLEANINEIFCDACDNHNNDLRKTLPSDSVQLLGNMWQLKVPRTASFSILQKYQIALVLMEKGKFDRGVLPYQDVDLLIKLRNALIHYEPESIISISDIPDKPVTEHKFEKRLQYKFKLNPLTGPGNPFYPDKVLGHGCCEWAIKNCISFTD